MDWFVDDFLFLSFLRRVELIRLDFIRLAL